MQSSIFVSERLGYNASAGSRTYNLPIISLEYNSGKPGKNASAPN